MACSQEFFGVGNHHVKFDLFGHVELLTRFLVDMHQMEDFFNLLQKFWGIDVELRN